MSDESCGISCTVSFIIYLKMLFVLSGKLTTEVFHVTYRNRLQQTSSFEASFYYNSVCLQLLDYWGRHCAIRRLALPYVRPQISMCDKIVPGSSETF